MLIGVGRHGIFVAFLAGAAWLLALAGAVPAAPQGKKAAPYQIVDGRIDSRTYNGFRRYNGVCSHCHGPDGVGSTFGPSLVEMPMEIDEFRAAVLNGRANGMSVMKGFADDPNVAAYVDDIYAYLCARADGRLGRGRPLPFETREREARPRE